MRRSLRPIAAVVLAAATVVLTAGASSSAPCPAPTFSISPDSGPPGGAVEINGSNFFRSCGDPDPNTGNTVNERDTGIRIMFVQGGDATLIGSASASSDGRIDGTVYVPRSARSGAASIRAEGTNGEPSAGYTVSGAAVTSTTASTTPRSTTTTVPRSTTSTVRPSTTTTTTRSSTTSTTGRTTTTSRVTSTTSAGEREFGAGGVQAENDDDDDATRTGKILAVGFFILAVVAAIFYLLSRAGAPPAVAAGPPDPDPLDDDLR